MIKMKTKKKQFNQYFTPARVARFMMELIKKFNPCLSLTPSSFIDPACGEGAFLKAALEENITNPSLCYGIDMDSDLEESWNQSGFSSLLKSNIMIYDALFTDIPGAFRIVAGNPPFGSISLKPGELDRFNSFEIFRAYLHRRKIKTIPPSFPIEILFLEKFIQLAEPGGTIAIVLPEGIPANGKMDYVRDFVEKKCRINAIISPKSEIFTREGTGAMTCLMFLTRKTKEEEERGNNREVEESEIGSWEQELEGSSYKVLMSIPEIINITGNSGKKDDLSRIIEDFPNFDNVSENHLPAWQVPFADMKGSRWDPGFHSPQYTQYMQMLKDGKYPLISLGELMPGDRIFTANKGVQKPAVTSDRVHYITSRQITETGIDITLHNLSVDKGGSCDPQRTRIRSGDILFVRSGDGCIGRAVVAGEEWEGNNIRSEIYILRPDPAKINPFYLALFFNMFKVLHKKHGVNFQLKRLLSGVGTPNLSKQEILSVMIPNVPLYMQINLEEDYRRIRDINSAYVREKMKRITEGRNREDIEGDKNKEKHKNTEEHKNTEKLHVEATGEMKDLLDKVANIMGVLLF